MSGERVYAKSCASVPFLTSAIGLHKAFGWHRILAGAVVDRVHPQEGHDGERDAGHIPVVELHTVLPTTLSE